MPVTGRSPPRAIALAIGLGAACTGAPGERCGPRTAAVARVIDGDTIELTTGARVRYLGVDAPEATGGHVECFGLLAARANADLVLGRAVELGYGGACEDRYGRTLARVRVDDLDVSARLIERGYACVLAPPGGGATGSAGDDRDPALDDLPALTALQAEARAARRGLWGACDPTPCR